MDVARPKTPILSDFEIRKILLRVETMDGLTTAEQADRLDVKPADLARWKKRSEELFTVSGPWQEQHEGKSWSDMPGGDPVTKRMNFSLFRRGKMTFNEDSKFVSATSKSKGRWRSKGPPKKSRAATDMKAEDVDVEAFREDDDGASKSDQALLAALLGEVERPDAPRGKRRVA